MRYFLLMVFAFCSIVFAQGVPGVITGGSTMKPQSADENLRSVSDWYTIRPLNISGEAGDVVVATKYARTVGAASRMPLLKCIDNNSATVAIVGVVFDCGDTLMNIKIGPYGTTGKLPVVKMIFKAGTSDSLNLRLQYQ